MLLSSAQLCGQPLVPVVRRVSSRLASWRRRCFCIWFVSYSLSRALFRDGRSRNVVVLSPYNDKKHGRGTEPSTYIAIYNFVACTSVYATRMFVVRLINIYKYIYIYKVYLIYIQGGYTLDGRALYNNYRKDGESRVMYF